GAKYNGEKRKFFFNQLEEKLQHTPGVISVGGVSALPMNGGWWGRSLTVEGFPVLSVGQAPMLLHQISLPGYFKAMGIPLEAGREFTDSDGTNGERLTIINQSIARRYFPNGDALGKRIRFGPPEDNEPWHTIIGVAGDVKQTGLDDHAFFCAYLPFNERATGTMDIVVRTSSSPEGLAQAVRSAVKDLDSSLPIIGLRSMDEIVSRSMWQQRLYSRLFALFGIVALVLAAVGIYGVMSYTVSQRTHEIGIRMALGAQAFDVLKSVLREGLLQIIIGLVIGLAASLALTRLMETVLFEVKTTDVATFTVVSALLALIALAACFIPARKASKVEPLVAMRTD